MWVMFHVIFNEIENLGCGDKFNNDPDDQKVPNPTLSDLK